MSDPEAAVMSHAAPLSAAKAGAGTRAPLLRVTDLRTHLSTRAGVVRAVDGISFDVYPGENLGLVGESGCGKTMTGLSILRLLPRPAGRIVGGEIQFDGQDILQLPEDEFRRLRGDKMFMILQDPMTSLNPVLTIANQVGEPLRLHRKLRGKQLLERVVSLLGLVQIPAPEVRARQYPHQMSGGMRQRIVSAMSIGCAPKLLIADEPTTALDVTTQLSLLKLLRDIQAQLGMAMIWITHDFGIVNRMCDRIAVMYAGKIMEVGPIKSIFKRPMHPYTVALLNSVPRVDRRVAKLHTIEGQPPDLHKEIKGCPFAPRCPLVRAICRDEFPPAVATDDGQHIAYCWDTYAKEQS